MTAAPQQLTVATEAPVQPLEQIPTGVVTLRRVCAAISREARAKGVKCSLFQALLGVYWLRYIVNKARLQPGKVYFPHRWEMIGNPYAVINAVMPHDRTSTPGTAHALLEEYLLDRTADEVSLLHDQRERTGYHFGRLFCSYQVCLGVLPDIGASLN